MRKNLARLTRFERATPAFGGQYSIQLSYRREGMQILSKSALRQRFNKRAGRWLMPRTVTSICRNLKVHSLRLAGKL